MRSICPENEKEISTDGMKEGDDTYLEGAPGVGFPPHHLRTSQELWQFTALKPFPLSSSNNPITMSFWWKQYLQSDSNLCEIYTTLAVPVAFRRTQRG